MEQNKIFVPGNLRAPAEYFPVPVYFENAKWRLVSDAVWLGVQLIGFLALIVFLGISLGDRFTFPPSFITQLLLIALPALAMAVIFANGSLDLSIGSVCGLTGVVAAQALVDGVPPVAAILAGLFVALLFGLFNAAVVGFARLPGIVVTFVVSIIARMLVLTITQGNTIGPWSERTDATLVLAALFGLILAGATFVWTQWPGFNARLAQRAGNAVGRVRLALPFLVSALAAGAAGIVLLWRVNYGTTSGGTYLEFQSVLVVALAGACFYGRYVNVVGVLLGAITFVMLQFLLMVTNLNFAVQYLILAVLFALAVGFTYLYHYVVGVLYRASLRKKEAAPQA